MTIYMKQLSAVFGSNNLSAKKLPNTHVLLMFHIWNTLIFDKPTQFQRKYDFLNIITAFTCVNCHNVMGWAMSRWLHLYENEWPLTNQRRDLIGCVRNKGNNCTKYAFESKSNFEWGVWGCISPPSKHWQSQGGTLLIWPLLGNYHHCEKSIRTTYADFFYIMCDKHGSIIGGIRIFEMFV